MNAIKVTLLGFTAFERATFETFFRLTSKRTPAYVAEADLAKADFIVADADDDTVCAAVLANGQLARSLMMGRVPRAGAGAQLARPINLMLVMRALDSLPRTPELVASSAAVPTAATAPAPAVVATTFEDTPRQELDLVLRTMALPSGVDPRALAAAAPQATATAAAAAAAKPAGTEQKMDHILVVDDSDVALRFMALHLQRYGFEIHLVRSGQAAIDQVARHHFEFVFLDVMMEGLDGFQTCKAIKRASYAGSRPPPTVVMVTSRGTAMDKLRGTMAGCDAYLTKPMEEAALLKIIGDREVQNLGFSDTVTADTHF
jgi:two-component system, cell cycle response regulator